MTDTSLKRDSAGYVLEPVLSVRGIRFARQSSMSLSMKSMLLVLVLPLWACTVQMPAERMRPSEAGPGEVAIELASGASAVIVPVRIHGEGPFRFILDTGATLTCIDTVLATKLNLDPRTGVIGRGFGVGSQGRVGMVTIDSFEVGSSTARDLIACTLGFETIRGSGLDVQGLVGLNFLREYRVTLDFERLALKLEKPGT
jgi:hypothetical protein